MKANKTINLSTKTNLLEQDLYEYKLQDVSQPELFREIFPYNEVPRYPTTIATDGYAGNTFISLIPLSVTVSDPTRAIYYTADGRFV